ncbi:hypothetical protein D4764_03G0003350 [Takifugu flavidus]|uniref:Uncharacterized protein n=1 Tax=Takifugu flavidus TaxID=433684 RepID=A0A5C6NCH1_9TELE|nr:hypothetical protein D4764_03G0003350 [Takifugu flavidus]
MLRDHSDQGLGWGVGGGAGEGCAGSAGAGESSLTDSLDGTEVWPPASKVYSCGATEDRKLT